jgi:molybdopterin converting factor small subunit
MATVNFTYALKRFFPEIESCEIKASSIKELFDSLEKKYPGISNYILEDHGHVRKHVNIFVNNNLISDRENLSDQLDHQSEVYIMQALSGG